MGQATCCLQVSPQARGQALLPLMRNAESHTGSHEKGGAESHAIRPQEHGQCGAADEEFEAGGEDLEGHIRAITEERRRRSQTPGSLEPELARAANVNPNATPAALDFGAGTPRTPGGSPHCLSQDVQTGMLAISGQGSTVLTDP